MSGMKRMRLSHAPLNGNCVTAECLADVAWVAVIIFIYKVVLLGDPVRHKDEQNSTAKTWSQMTWYSPAGSGLKVCLLTLSGNSISIQGYMA